VTYSHTGSDTRSDLGASGSPQDVRQAEAKNQENLEVLQCSALLAESKEQRLRPRNHSEITVVLFSGYADATPGILHRDRG
jgi:hypothetical protein